MSNFAKTNIEFKTLGGWDLLKNPQVNYPGSYHEYIKQYFTPDCPGTKNFLKLTKE